MNQIGRAGIGIIIIGLAFVLPYVEFLGFTLEGVDFMLRMIIQIGMVLTGLGLVIENE